MTFITKPAAIIKKPIIKDVPVAEKSVLEEKVEIYPEYGPNTKLSKINLMLMFVIAFLALCLIIGLTLYKDVPSNKVQPFHSICDGDAHKENPTVSDQDLDELYLIFMGEPIKNSNSLARVFEKVNIVDNVEKLTIISHNQVFNFIHDFNENTSAIVDKDRCFVMELVLGPVLLPEQFVSSVKSLSSDFGMDMYDVMPLLTEMLVELPAQRHLISAVPDLATACKHRPIYRLHRTDIENDEKLFVSNYIQLAGIHVEHIKIRNWDDMLEYEKKIKG